MMTKICYVWLVTSLIVTIHLQTTFGVVKNVAITARQVDNEVSSTNQSNTVVYSSTARSDVSNTTVDPEAVNKTGDGEPEPETETEPDAETEGETESEGETEAEGEGEPEGEAESPEPESEDSFAEPGPDWEEAKQIWNGAWEFHVYVFGISFTILGIFCTATIIRLWKMNHLLSKNYFLCLNLLNVTVCVLRSIYLFVDPYNSRKLFPPIVDYFVYSTVFPCLTALFSVLFYALLLATRFRIMSKKVQKFRVLLGIIAIHFLLSIVTDIVVGLSSNAFVLVFICQVFYVLWGLIMFIGYVLIFKRMHHRVLSRQSTKERNAKLKYTDSQIGNRPAIPKRHKSTLGTAIQITLASALFGVICMGFQLFGMFGVFGVIGSYTMPKPWPWWVYHTGLRLLELVMCLSIALVSSQPLKLQDKEHKCQGLLCLMPCCLLCYEHHELVAKNDDSNSKHSVSLDASVTIHNSKTEKANMTSSS